MNKYKVKMYDNWEDKQENYLKDEFIVISNKGLFDEEIIQACIKRRNENEDEDNNIEEIVCDIEYVDDDIEVIDLREEETNA